MDDRMSRQEQNSHCNCILFVLVNFALFVLLETGIAYRGGLKNWPAGQVSVWTMGSDTVLQREPELIKC